MGGLYNITYVGTDLTLGTTDDTKYQLYLNSFAYEWYIHNTKNFLSLIKSVPDQVIEIFNAQNSITVKEGSTYQELLSYFEYLGMPHDQAVAKAQASIGISRDTMIKALDQIQSQIIAQKSAQLIEYEQAIKTATTTDSILSLQSQLDAISSQSPTLVIGTVTVSTIGDISKQILGLTSTIKDVSILNNPDNFINQTISPTDQTSRTIESDKNLINKDPSIQSTIPTTTKQISEYIQDVNTFGKTHRTTLLIIIGVGIASIIGLNMIRNKKNGIKV